MAAEFRHEYKYLCSQDTLLVAGARLASLMKPDPHAGADGSYLVRSVYFDDPENRNYYENEDGEDPRAKYRLRIYNGSDERISLERKAKIRTMTHKDAVLVSRAEAEALLAGKIPIPKPEQPSMLRRMLADMRLRALHPAVIVQYRRTPFVLSTGNVRITLDEAITSSLAVRRFFGREIPGRQILADGQGILEVKWDSFLPDYLHRALELEKLQWSGFSKYYLCRRFDTKGGNWL